MAQEWRRRCSPMLCRNSEVTRVETGVLKFYFLNKCFCVQLGRGQTRHYVFRIIMLLLWTVSSLLSLHCANNVLFASTARATIGHWNSEGRKAVCIVILGIIFKDSAERSWIYLVWIQKYAYLEIIKRGEKVWPRDLNIKRVNKFFPTQIL